MKKSRVANKSIRERITNILASITEVTAAQIASHLGMADYPSEVVNELNAMRGDGLIRAETIKGTKRAALIYSLVTQEAEA